MVDGTVDVISEGHWRLFSPTPELPNSAKGAMKLLLTSAGIKNASIHDALLGLLGKPIAECDALCIPTASYGHAPGGIRGAWRFITGQATTPMCELGWQSLGVLELSALPSLEQERLGAGGRAGRRPAGQRRRRVVSGPPHAAVRPGRPAAVARTVWVGLSAGSMVMTPRIGEDFVTWKPPTGGDETLGVVDFSIFPHVDHPALPENTMAEAERWAGGLGIPAYAIDDDTAIRVVDGTVDVVSEGNWRLFNP